MKYILIILLFLFVPGAVFAQTITWNADNSVLELGNKLQVLEDHKGQLTFEQVNSADFSSKFKQSNKINLNFGYTESIFWLRFAIDNRSGKIPMLELMQPGLPVADLYYKDDSGKVVCIKAGYKVPLNEKLVKDHFQVYPIPQGKHEYFIRLFSNSGPIPVKLYDKASYDIKSNNEKLLYGFYMGFMFFLMLSNLFFFFSLGNRMYLFYSFNVIVYACYAIAVVDGFLPYIYPHADLIFWYTTIPTIGVVVQNLYCVSFLEVKKYAPKLNRFAWVVITYFIIYAIIKFALPFPTVLAVNTVNALLSFFMMGYIGLRVGKKGNKMGYYFAWAFFIYFGLVLCEASYIQTGSPAYFTELSHTAISTLVEAFILSFLLSKRLEWEKEAFELANTISQRQLLEKTRENERIVKEQNIILEQKVTERTHELINEKKKSDDLLLNILPADVAEELKSTGAAKAKSYDSVSVLFTDIVDFTAISQNQSPEQLVADIDYCFCAFDAIIKRNNLEKIKTIGDAYMCAGGLPIKNDTHAADIVKAALEICEFMKKTKEEKIRKNETFFEIRLGISSGPVVAGIVGSSKFVYDIWGDTVNTASRMEQNSEAGKVNISQTTYELVKDRFTCTYRGEIDAKGKGKVKMYFVTPNP